MFGTDAHVPQRLHGSGGHEGLDRPLLIATWMTNTIFIQRHLCTEGHFQSMCITSEYKYFVEGTRLDFIHGFFRTNPHFVRTSICTSCGPQSFSTNRTSGLGVCCASGPQNNASAGPWGKYLETNLLWNRKGFECACGSLLLVNFRPNRPGSPVCLPTNLSQHTEFFPLKLRFYPIDRSYDIFLLTTPLVCSRNNGEEMKSWA